MKTIRFYIAAPVLFIAFVLNGCSSGSYEITTTLQSSVWQLESLNGKPITLPEGKTVTLIINAEAGRASGMAPCNTYTCSYDQSNSRLTFSSITSTKMACDELSAESEYYTMLGKVTKFRQSAQKLILFNGNKVIAEFILKQ